MCSAFNRQWLLPPSPQPQCLGHEYGRRNTSPHGSRSGLRLLSISECAASIFVPGFWRVASNESFTSPLWPKHDAFRTRENHKFRPDRHWKFLSCISTRSVKSTVSTKHAIWGVPWLCMWYHNPCVQYNRSNAKGCQHLPCLSIINILKSCAANDVRRCVLTGSVMFLTAVRRCRVLLQCERRRNRACILVNTSLTASILLAFHDRGF